MSDIVPIVKNEKDELLIPTVWRKTFYDIIEVFKSGDFRLDNKVDFVHTVSDEDAERISANITDYGDTLVSIVDETWQSSIYRWMGNYWQVLVDLSTLNEDVSDLVMFVKVQENMEKYCFTIESVHVP